MDEPKFENTFEGKQYNEPVTLAPGGLPTIGETAFLPPDVIPLDQETRDQRKLRRLATNPTRVLVKGGKRVVTVKCKIPVEQYAGLQRFEGVTDSDKINAIIRMANRRVDEVARMNLEEQRKLQATE